MGSEMCIRDRSWGYGVTGHFGQNPSPGISLIGGGKALLSSAPKDALGVGLNACNIYKNGIIAAENVKCPTLCLVGSDDKMTPRIAGEKLASKIRGSNIQIVKSAGHMIMMEKSYETLQYLKSHLSLNCKD